MPGVGFRFCVYQVNIMRSIGFMTVVLGLAISVGCQSLQPNVYRQDLVTDSGEPAYITVQHCLIGFQGATTGVTRTREEAEALAMELLEKAKNGESFEQIVQKYTDDSPPGIYKMANHGFEGNMTSSIVSRRVFERGAMVAAFGDTGFPLQVGEFGLAAYDRQTSPFGWHIIKRIK